MDPVYEIDSQTVYKMNSWHGGIIMSQKERKLFEEEQQVVSHPVVQLSIVINSQNLFDFLLL